ncbi:hypothetical protein OXX80_000817 [Metschnikowia pulcherrima]
MSMQLLTVGEHPNLAFYAWRLHATKACAVTMVSASLDPETPLEWRSSQLGAATFAPKSMVQSLQQLDPSRKYDVVIVSVSNLQSFQEICAQLSPFLHQNSLIVVESTGYVSLEPFVVSSYPKQKKVTVCSIMNEADVKRRPSSNEFLHAVLNQDQRIYLGTCSNESKSVSKVADSAQYANFYKLLQKAQEQSGGCISLLRSNNYKEFMTYQWKLALPRIVLNPLSVIFEEPYPANLDKQILAKPLISGLVNEIFKIIKKMECKLIKGFENEGNIMKNWSAQFPAVKTAVSPEFANSNSVFYNFYHRLDVDVDLLLLQPILLGDDHGVRTPYLENLYSIVCQLLKMNSADSLFFTRKTELSEKHAMEMGSLQQNLASLKLERENVENEVRERSKHMHQLETTFSQRQQAQDALVRKFEEQSRLYDGKIGELGKMQAQKESILADLDSHLQQKSAALRDVEARLAQGERALGAQEKQANQANQVNAGEKETAKNDDRGLNSAELAPHAPSGQNGAANSQTFDLSHMQTPDLSEYADVAVYGAALNGDIAPPVPQAPHNSVSQSAGQNGPVTPENNLSQKEKELMRREQALLERESELRSQGQPANIQGENFYDSQSGEQYHDVSSGYAAQPGPHSGNFNGANGNFNGANGNPGFQGQNYRQSFSLTGPNPYNPQYEGNNYDQRPPHGLPPNGFPQHSLPPTLRNPQRYQQNGINQQMPPMQQQMQQQQMQQMPQPRPRVSSHSSGPAGLSYQASQQNLQQQNISPNGGQQNMGHRANSLALQQQLSSQMNPHPQMQSSSSSQYLLNQQAGHGVSQGYPGKKNRRSAFPDQALNIDYGGRGGMPMPAANGGGKHKSVMMGGSGLQASPPMISTKKSFSGINPSAQSHLRIPNQNTSSNSDSLTSHGSMNEESPKPATPDSSRDIRLDVPVAEPVGKPLGAIAPPPETQKKKKKGLFKKH